MKIHVIIGFVLVASVVSSDAAPFKSWFKFPWFQKSLPEVYEEHPKIVEIVKHVPVIQKIEVIKPVEIIKTVEVPVEVIKEVEVIKHVPIIQEVIKEVQVKHNIALPQEVIKEVEVHKEIPVVKTVEVPKPYEVVKHVPIVKEVEKHHKIEKPTTTTTTTTTTSTEKVPFISIQKYKHEIPLPSFPNVKELFHHQYETTSEVPVETESSEHKVHSGTW